jgi:hypothetical protein
LERIDTAAVQVRAYNTTSTFARRAASQEELRYGGFDRAFHKLDVLSDPWASIREDTLLDLVRLDALNVVYEATLIRL